MSCRSAEPVEDAGREVVLGPAMSRTLRVQRKVFVPAGGGFARYLEVLTNTSPQAVTATVSSYSEYAYGIEGEVPGPLVMVDPTTTGGTYVVLSQSSEGGGGGEGEGEDSGDDIQQAVLGNVFAGTEAPVGVTDLDFSDHSHSSAYGWRVTVPANTTVILMHFLIQGTPHDVAGAQARAQALVNLTDPEALSGMTAAERAQVVNFVVPAP
jgi:hypothetical protein